MSTNEEIGQVARAVDDLHRQAIHLASGEAQLRQTVNAMFVTLQKLPGRRSHSIVELLLCGFDMLGAFRRAALLRTSMRPAPASAKVLGGHGG